MDRIRHAVVNAQWFSALGSYQPSEGQIALPNLSAWDRPRFPAELDTSLAKIASDMDWLPSSRDQPDPIHGEHLRSILKDNGTAYQQEVLESYKLALKSLRVVPDRTIFSGANDFTQAAKDSAIYCVRMATLEVLSAQPDFWLDALMIYHEGNWPCGLLPDGTLVVF